MGDFSQRIESQWKESLRDLLAKATALGPKAVWVFDLDSTVFDNRPRQARIVREFGKAQGAPKLLACESKHFTSGWDLRGAVTSLGHSSAEADAMYPSLKAFWQERFFTSAYCVDDIEVPGAARFLKDCVATGAQVVYCTGRHEAMRAGTVQCLTQCAMPLPDGKAVRLVMKPTLESSDDAFKRDAHRELEGLGQVFAAFDNEPTHANDYALRFPSATVVHLDTDHSGRPVALDKRIITIPRFP